MKRRMVMKRTWYAAAVSAAMLFAVVPPNGLDHLVWKKSADGKDCCSMIAMSYADK